MKKEYCKPTFVKMELRPEERLALCDWPSPSFSDCTGTCTNNWPSEKDHSNQCKSIHNNATITGS